MSDLGNLRTNWALWGVPFPVGGEWDAGLTPPHTPQPQSGRWFIRRVETRFLSCFHYFVPAHNVLLDVFPPDEAGEMAAKTDAVSRRERRDVTPSPRVFLSGSDGRVPGLRIGSMVRVWKCILGTEYSSVGLVSKMRTDELGQELIYVDADWWVNANGLEDVCELIAPPE